MQTERNRMSAFRELRASPRHDVEITARLSVDGELLKCELRDVSRGGTFATCPRLPCGKDVRLWFRIPGHDVIEIEAVARWSNHEGVGLQFGSLRARDAWALGQYLASLRNR